MKLKPYHLLILFLLGLQHSLWAQNRHFIIDNNFTKIEIPFTLVNNLMVVNVRYNKTIDLTFILDTGAENTILIHKEIAMLLDVKFHRKFTIIGADLLTELTAYLTLNNSLEFGDLKITNHPVLTLDDDYFNFKEKTGLEINGIIGADIFKRFIVQINYLTKVLTLHNPEKHKLPNKKYKPIPLEFIKNKPYINPNIEIQKDTFSVKKKLLIDTGSATSLLLQTNAHESLKLPNQVIKTQIGFGLGGTLEGYFGRIHELEIGDFKLGSIPTIFQKLPESYLDKELVRDGLIGNEILSHFHIIIDYIHERLYLAPNRNYSDEFEYDKSGLTFISGQKNSTFLVSYVVPGSPADEVGIKIGDRIKSFNRIPIIFYNIGEVSSKLRKKTGKRIRLKVIRNDKKQIFTFHLRDLI